MTVADEVAEIRWKTGLTNQQVRRWTHTARTRNYIKRIEETGKLLIRWFCLDGDSILLSSGILYSCATVYVAGDYVVHRRGTRVFPVHTPSAAATASATSAPAALALTKMAQASSAPLRQMALPKVTSITSLSRPSNKGLLEEWLAKNHRKVKTVSDLYRVSYIGKISLLTVVKLC